MYRHSKETVLEDAYVSSTNTVTSEVTDLTFESQIGYIVFVATGGSAAGTAIIEVSADYDPVLNSGTFTTLPAAYQFYDPVVLTAGTFPSSALSAPMIANQLPFHHARVSYTNTSGNGYITVKVNCKDV